MASWDMLKTIRSATELTEEIIRLTDKFPPEERFVLSLNLRVLAMAVLENTAYCMARFEVANRFKFLTRAINLLVELNSQCTLCKTMRLITPEDHNSLRGISEILRKHLMSVSKNIESIDISMPPKL